MHYVLQFLLQILFRLGPQLLSTRLDLLRLNHWFPLVAEQPRPINRVLQIIQTNRQIHRPEWMSLHRFERFSKALLYTVRDALVRLSDAVDNDEASTWYWEVLEC